MIRWGIIGTGTIARKFAKSIVYAQDSYLYGVASRDLDRAKQFKNEFCLDKAYGSYEELVNDRNIDAVYIATVNTFHKEQALLCIKNKKAVLCEKPLTVNALDATVLYEAAKENGVFLMEAMWTKFLPAILKAQEWVKAGLIGEVKLVNCDFAFLSDINPDSRLYDLKLAGGALLDIGVYTITMASLFLGTDELSIKAEGYIGNTGVDESTSIILKNRSGAIAQLFSSISVSTQNCAYIYGTKGYIKIPQYWQAEKAYLYVQDQPETVYENRFNGLGYEYEISEAAKCLIEGKTESDINPMTDTIAILKIMDEVRHQIHLRYREDSE